MMRLLTAFVFLIAIVLPILAVATDFEIKGTVLGVSEEYACGTLPIAKHQEVLDAVGDTGVVFPASMCEVPFTTVAGIKPTSAARLLFWKGRLIRMLLDFDNLDAKAFASLRMTLIGAYGKPTTKNVTPIFRVDIWRSGTQTLQLERTVEFPTNASVSLTDETGFAAYERVGAVANKAVDEIVKKQRLNDLRH